MVKYSVIVPIYNAEKTLRRCIDSLLDQKYDDMELILVNDGSLDGSLEICSVYRARDPRIRVIDKPNGGVSSARNAGLDIATGEYVLFVDSDDYIVDHYFETLDMIGTLKNYDCIFFSLAEVDGNNCTPRTLTSFQSKTEDEAVEMFAKMLYWKYLNHPVNKRYKRSIIEANGLRFPLDLTIGEDKVFCLNYVLHCRDCYVSSDVLYYACLDNKESLSRKLRENNDVEYQRLDQSVQQVLESAEIPRKYHTLYVAAENLIQLRAVYSNTKRMHLAGKKWRIRRCEIQKMCRDINARKLSMPSGKFSILLQIPVRLKLVTVIDLMGWYLAR